MTKRSLDEFYNELFEGVVANTTELRNECYRIRYKVYCIENTGYENPDDFPDGLEHDIYDQHSVHALLRFKPLNTYVGTVRLILNQPNVPNALPVYKLCADNKIQMPEFYPLQNIAEISRFCIIKDFRRRALDTIISTTYSAEELERDKARIIPSMSLGLISMLVLMARENNIQQWCAEMEPFLIRLLTKLGIYFDPVGPLIEFHGQRQICQKPLDVWLERIAAERPEVWNIVTNNGAYCPTKEEKVLESMS